MKKTKKHTKSSFIKLKELGSKTATKIKLFYKNKTWEKITLTLIIAVIFFVIIRLQFLNNPKHESLLKRIDSSTVIDEKESNNKNDPRNKKLPKITLKQNDNYIFSTEEEKTIQDYSSSPLVDETRKTNDIHDALNHDQESQDKQEPPSHIHEWNPTYTHYDAQPAQGYYKKTPVISKEVIYVYFGDGYKITEKDLDEGFDIDQYSAVNDTNWWTGIETVIITPEHTEWIETAPAKAARDKLTGYHCSCGETKGT